MVSIKFIMRMMLLFVNIILTLYFSTLGSRSPGVLT